MFHGPLWKELRATLSVPLLVYKTINIFNFNVINFTLQMHKNALDLKKFTFYSTFVSGPHMQQEGKSNFITLEIIC